MEGTLSTSRFRSYGPLLAVLLAAAAIRGGALWAMHEKLSDDPDGYRQIAQGVLWSGEYTRDVPLEHGQEMVIAATPTAYRPPLYPLLLTKLSFDRRHVQPLAVGICHMVLGLLTVALVYRLGGDLGLSRWRAAAGALLVACDPILVQQGVLVMTETLATLLAVAAWWCLARYTRRQASVEALFAGTAIGLAALCRPTFLPWGLLVALAMLVWASSGNWKLRLAHSSLLAVGILLVLSPWVIRNYLALGKPIATTTHGGYTLYLANNDEFYDWLNAGRPYAWPGFSIDAKVSRSIRMVRLWGPPWSAQERGEIHEDRVDHETALETIRARPGMFVYSCFVRVGYLWSPVPQKTQLTESTYRTLGRYGVAIWYTGVYLLAALGGWKLRRQLLRAPWLWGVTLCLAFTLVHAVYWSNLRMRAPLMPVVALLAAAGSGYSPKRERGILITAGELPTGDMDPSLALRAVTGSDP